MFPFSAAFPANANEQFTNSSYEECTWNTYYPHFPTYCGFYDYSYCDYYCYTCASYGQHYYADYYQTVYCYSPVFYDMNGYPIAMYFAPVFYYIIPVNYVPVKYTAIDIPAQYYDVRDFSDPNDFEYRPLENSLSNLAAEETTSHEYATFEVFYEDAEHAERLNDALFEDDEKKNNDNNSACNLPYFNGVGVKEPGDYTVRKKLTTVTNFHSLRDDILKLLVHHFMDKEGPSEYDYYVEKIYDEYREHKMTFQVEGKWNRNGLKEFLNQLDISKIAHNSPSEAKVEACEKVDDTCEEVDDTCEGGDDQMDEDEYLEYLCNIHYGITLQELRALEERTSDSEYWPGPQKLTLENPVCADDKLTPYYREKEDLERETLTPEDPVCADDKLTPYDREKEDLERETLTPEDPVCADDKLTPYDREKEDLERETLTPEDPVYADDKLIPYDREKEDLERETLTPEDPVCADDKLTPYDREKEDLERETLTPEDPVCADDKLTPYDREKEDLERDTLTPEDPVCADDKLTYDREKEVLERVQLKPSFEGEKSSENPDGPHESDEESKEQPKGRFKAFRKWLSRTFCCCFKTKDPP